MATKDGPASAGKRPEPNKTAGPGSATDALRKEAERRWADSDRKAAKAVRRTKARAKRPDGRS